RPTEASQVACPASRTPEKAQELRTPRPKRRVAGGHGAGEPPVPIPNTVVKPRSADGTARATGWESTSPPAQDLVTSVVPTHPGRRSSLFFASADRFAQIQKSVAIRYCARYLGTPPGTPCDGF